VRIVARSLPSKALGVQLADALPGGVMFRESSLLAHSSEVRTPTHCDRLSRCALARRRHLRVAGTEKLSAQRGVAQSMRRCRAIERSVRCKGEHVFALLVL
jgi:hypothetical protein